MYPTCLKIALLLLFTGISATWAQQKDFLINAVAFYNLENLFDTEDDPYKNDDDFTPSGANSYTEELYQKKLHNLAQVISKLAIDKVPDGPSIIGVAEIENDRVLQDLINQPELKNRNYRFVHFDGPDHRSIDCGLLYHPAYFKVITATALPVPIEEKGKKEATRDILYVTGQMGNDTLHILINHWPSRRGGEAATVWKRAVAAGINKQLADSLLAKNNNTKIIIMGDLNDDPVSPSVTKTLGAKGDRKKVFPGELFNPWMEFYKNGLGTLGYNDSWNLFDQIIISYGFIQSEVHKWRYYQAEIFNRKFMINQFGRYKGYPHRSFSGNTWIDGYSDHFPTILYFIQEQD